MDCLKQKFQIVIAKYNEDIKWLFPFKDITIIYNKGINNINMDRFETIRLPNIGRESHTYLYHIINNYDNLADKTIFLQGSIIDHKIFNLEDYFKDDDFIGKLDILKLDKLKNKIEHYGKWKIDYKNGDMKICNYTPYDWITKIIGIDIQNNIDINIDFINVVWGANFAVSKRLIHSKPKEFYENIIRYIDYHKNPEEGHFLERSWYIIFHNKYIPKKKIGYIFLQNINDCNSINTIDDYDIIHIWFPLTANYNFGLYNKINYTPNNNKYLIINPVINNNEFYLKIKGNNDAHILITFEDCEDIYEIVFGGWDNNRSVVRDFYKNTIINSYEIPVLNINEYIKFQFSILDSFVIKKNDIIIFDFKNIFQISKIKNIKIKSYFGSNIYWDYEHIGENNDKIKYYLSHNIYEDPKYFYKNNYLDYYVTPLFFYSSI